MGIITFLDYIGIIAFSISGASKAIKLKMDYFGILALATVTAIGGGVIRDIIIKDGLPTFFLKIEYSALIFATTVFMIIIKGNIKFGFVLDLVDALGLATFTVEAGLIALDYQLNFITFLFVSLITAVGGGIIRDIMSQEIPRVLNKEVYASASIVGSIVFWFARQAMPTNIACYLCIGLIFSIRAVTMIFHMGLPKVLTEEP